MGRKITTLILPCVLAATILASCAGTNTDPICDCFVCGEQEKQSLMVWVNDEPICPNCFAADGGENYRFCLNCGKAYSVDSLDCGIGYCYDCTGELFTGCCICEDWPLLKCLAYKAHGVYTCARCVAAYYGDTTALDAYIEENSVYYTTEAQDVHEAQKVPLPDWLFWQTVQLPIEDRDPPALVDTARSTCFSGVGYVEDGMLLYVQFRESGRMYAYEGVSAETYQELLDAPSMGGYYNEYIKGLYVCHRLG